MHGAALTPVCLLLLLQVAYFITCRFLKTSTFHPRVFRGNKMIYVSVPITIGLMVSQHTSGDAAGTIGARGSGG